MDIEVVHPGLIKALEAFAVPNAFSTTERFYRHDKGTSSTGWSESQACGMAAALLKDQKLYQMKFRVLVRGLKDLGLERAYERVMREPIQGRDLN